MVSSAPLNVDDIRRALATKSVGHRLYLHQELSSTNDEALSLAQGEAPHGTVVLAESQLSGRGRHGRTWFSPPGMNVYCSIIVRRIGQNPPRPPWLCWIPLISALAVAKAVNRVASLSLSLKWPNDLLLQEQKVGGVLCESSSASAVDPVVVIGIGLNVNAPHESFPEELRPIASSLFEGSRHSIDRNQLLAQIFVDLEQQLDELASSGPTPLRQAYTARCITLGQRVRVLLGAEQELIGTAEAIAADGALQVRPLSASSTSQPLPLIDVHAADVIHLGG
jgi:BirA family biotin operon repressor/biotin-[acetyl-CoA-carboxylase] ligase